MTPSQLESVVLQNTAITDHMMTLLTKSILSCLTVSDLYKILLAS